MLSFGQTKNSLEQLRKYLTKMQLFGSGKITSKDLDEPNFRKAGNELFLPLINFILIEYSTEIYWKIIEMIPSIKVVDDKQFVEHCFAVARKIIGMEVQLTSDQFLSNKYFERKLEFVSKLAKSVYERSEAIKKSKAKSISTYLPEPGFGSIQQNYVMEKMDDHEDEEEEEVPRVIKAIPAKLDLNVFPKQKELKETVPLASAKNRFMVRGEEFEEEEIERFMSTIRDKEAVRRPVAEPAALPEKKFSYREKQPDSEQEVSEGTARIPPRTAPQPEESYNRFRLDPAKNQIKQIADEESVEYVSKEDFTELLQLVMTTSQTVNELSGKFCQFQAKVGAEVSNISARVLMLENNVRLLKDNL